MATRTNALPTFDVQSSWQTVIYWGGTSTTGTLLGQVNSVEYSGEIQTTEHNRVGDSTTYYSYTTVNYNWSMEIFADGDISEVALILENESPPTNGTWAGTEDIELRTDTATTTITLYNYDAEATSATLESTETLSGVKVISFNAGRTADGDILYTTEGTMTGYKIEPEATLVIAS